MTFDPNQKRDGHGMWSAGGAATWLKSDEAKAALAKLNAPEHIKNAATMAIQGALFKVGVNDPHIDQFIKHQVSSFANDVKVTRSHARQVMIAAVKALRKV